ncbi:adenylate/guanylate cyclase domain-containing protein [Nocardia sp. CDC160]|uniref:adenylate/guanylate cyclase domain-containing protein n=1 Tax=Nocardia sp. CDC160 TaxID=3112166 RepID=UPI002DBB3BBD|nr:adenylate/guanylate cyclase domain-containing protein [Nocardia sp. CDC160]MEC3914773.1 adenylate/guanylate cyclase domain-containing protein [Nocardia sp. CDC160]
MSKSSVLTWVAAISLPVAGLWLLLSHPRLDVHYEHHPEHFWLVLAAAALAMALGIVLYRAARARHDLRLVLVSLMFQFAAGFLGLHAIATPGVIIQMPNAGFVYAVPVGLTLGGFAALASAFEYGPVGAARMNRLIGLLSALPVTLLIGWAMLSLTGLPPFDATPSATETSRSLIIVAYAGSLSYLGAAVVYARQFYRRRGLLLLSVLSAFVLLIEALLAVGYGRSWQASWWEWHALMVAAFALIAVSSHVQFRREGSSLGLFDSVTLNQTMANLERDYTRALTEMVEVLRQRAAVGVPVDQPLGSVGVELSKRFGLTERQLAVLEQNARLYRQLDQLFRSYMSPQVATALIANPAEADLGGRIAEVSVLMADLSGFTPFAERTDPALVVQMLNTYYGAIVPVILEEGGVVVQFVGDAVMAVFNAPTPQPDHALRAARAGLRLQQAVAHIAAGRPDWPRFRVGVNTGPALVGNIGAAQMRNYTAIGDTTNTAARLQGVAQPGDVVIGPQTRAQLGPRAFVQPLHAIPVKGRREPVNCFVLRGVR